jgi:type IV pilus assembly protein PilA
VGFIRRSSSRAALPLQVHGHRSERGFTLIELMVVVLIIAILIAIAIPTFLAARSRAQDRAAQSDLRNALTAEKTYFLDKQQYDATTATMKGVEVSLNWNGASTSRPATDVTVGTTVSTNDTVCITETSKSGNVFSVADVATGANANTYYNKGACSLALATLQAAPWKTTSW